MTEFPDWGSDRVMDFALPPEITVSKQRVDQQWVYSFRHEDLGGLGRIIVQGLPNGQCNLAIEVAGDPSDPMTEIRLAILQPISEYVTATMESVFGAGDQAQVKTAPATPRGPTEVVESKLMPCDRCGDTAAMLIFAYGAATHADFEDYARKMYPKYSVLDVPTWIIGEPLGAPGFETPSRILQVWPQRGLILEMTPTVFNAELDGVLARHC
jgi:hypothetical protein